MKKLVAAIAMVILVPTAAFAEDEVKETSPKEQTSGEQQPAVDHSQHQPPAEEKVAPAATVEKPAAGQAPTASNAALMTPEQLAASDKWRLALDLENAIGSGTFVNAESFASVSTTLTTQVSKSFRLVGKNLLTSARGQISYEYSPPDSENGRAITWSDLRLGASLPSVYTESFSGISVSPGLTVTIPLTLESWTKRNIAGLGASVALGRAIGPVALKLSGNAGYIIGASDSANLSASATDYPTVICRASDSFACSSAGMNAKYSLGTGLTADYGFNDKLSFNASLAYRVSFKNAATWERDEFTPKATDVNGNPVARVGMGPGDLVTGSLSASYALTDIFSVSAGVGTEGPPKTMDNKTLRNPFIDFWSPARNLTLYSIAVSASL